MRTYTIHEVKQIARLLLCEGAVNELGAEYNRGICELIADLDGLPDVDHADRSQQIATELKCTIIPFINVGNDIIEGEKLGEMNHLGEPDTER